MKKFKAILVLAVLPIAIGCSKNDSNSISYESQLEKTGVLSRVIIESGNLGPIASEVGKSGGHVVRNMEFINALVVNVPVQALNGLKHKFPEAVISEDKVLSLVDPVLDTDAKPGGGGSTPPPETVPWGVSAVKADLAWSTSRGSGVKVCVVDTGIDQTHPDLVGNIIGGRNYVFSKGVVDSNKWDDDNGHGSHVAGTIAAVDNTIGPIGVAPDTKLYGVKVLNRQGSGYVSDIADGIYACINAGTQIINLSLGGSGDPAEPSVFKTAIDAAISSGIYVVAAAGNSDKDISGYTPSGYAGVIAVSAVDSSYVFASWTNFGLQMDDFAAPGVGIFSTWKDGGYNTISGTSMAAPHVAGVIALGISARSKGPVGRNIGAPMSLQGAGFIDSLLTLSNL